MLTKHSKKFFFFRDVLVIFVIVFSMVQYINRVNASNSISYSTQWSTPGPAYAVTVDSSNNVYVNDVNSGRIRKYDSSGNFILQWGSLGSGDGQFTHANNIATDSAGNVYVSDNNSRIQKFDSSGGFLFKWGTAGSGDGEFN